ncbi:MAG TPA: NmrA family NAD(P)-binding protein [Dongiaceae bacterium]|nr:NmrA family NAD(P)-binding protein [Dongiaceae bacterium]
MFVVLGASGNTGSVVTKKLLEKGEKVRVVGRDAGRLEPLTRLGAEPFVSDVTESAALTKAFAGAKGAYLLVPPRLKDADMLAASDRMSSAMSEAVRNAGVSHVVLLSSVGAQHDAKTGPILGLHWFENKLRQVPNLNAVFLRPAFFMENFFMLIGLIQSMGFLAGGIKADLKMPMIATRDIGAAAAETLLDGTFSGIAVRELHGQRDISHDEAAAALGSAIGKPKLSYQRFPSFMVQSAMKQMGLPGKTAALMAELNEAANDGLLDPTQPRSAATTTPTSIEAFAQEVFAPAYNAKAAAGA